MSTNEPDQLEFQGRDLIECEQFIAAVNKHARAEGKLRDDQWIADFVAVCLVKDALIWWSSLDPETQGSWRLLRQAMISRFRPLFYGRSGAEAEDFVHRVRQRALNLGTHNDPHWMADFTSTCFAGGALRWYASLEPCVRSDWGSLQQAIFTQYPKGFEENSAAPIVPAQTSTRPRYRGRIRVCRKNNPDFWYLSKFICTISSDLGRIMRTSLRSEALEVEYEPASASEGLHTLTIPDGQTQGYNLLGMKWTYADTSRIDNPLVICCLSSSLRNESICTGKFGPLLAAAWEISSSANEDGARPVWGMRSPGRRLITQANPGSPMWIWLRETMQGGDAMEVELLFEPI